MMRKREPSVGAPDGTICGVDMSKAKEQIVRIVNELPDDSSYDEILRELAFERMVARGLRDSDAGRVISNEEMERRIRSWAK